MSLDKAGKKAANKIIKKLGEKNGKAHGQIYRLVEHGGIDFVEELLRDTLEIEEQGGLMTLDGKRRRTIGGVFLHLAKQRVPEEYMQIIFHPPRKKQSEDNANNSDND